MNSLLLIDGNNLFHRAYHALPPLTDKTGQNANAVFGFSNMLIKAVNEVKPTYVACAFDTAAPTFRHIEFEKYKAQRPAPPPDLYPQLPKVKSVLDAFGIPYFTKEGYEADDLLATIATAARKKKIVTTILSGDRDVLQIVDGDIKVQMPGWNLTTTTLYGRKEVIEKFGIEPRQMVDYKSLIGDTSDNVPGIAGIGPKTASDLLQKYDNLETVFERLDEISPKVADKLRTGRDLALAAKSLVELDCDVDLEFKIEDLRFNPDWELVRAEYEKLGFKSIASKISGGRVTEETFSSAEASEDKKDEEKGDQLELI
ncbi:MAG: hypothetical protein NUV69_05480 [Candidatus Curtissbacteria bacterium]|nr:hypothetical protein [Candidatus Curtissbacteria bacterium]